MEVVMTLGEKPTGMAVKKTLWRLGGRTMDALVPGVMVKQSDLL